MEPILLPAAIEEIIGLDCEGPRELHLPLESSASLAAVQVYFGILLQSVPPCACLVICWTQYKLHLNTGTRERRLWLIELKSKGVRELAALCKNVLSNYNVTQFLLKLN